MLLPLLRLVVPVWWGLLPFRLVVRWLGVVDPLLEGTRDAGDAIPLADLLLLELWPFLEMECDDDEAGLRPSGRSTVFLTFTVLILTEDGLAVEDVDPFDFADDGIPFPIREKNMMMK